MSAHQRYQRHPNKTTFLQDYSATTFDARMLGLLQPQHRHTFCLGLTIWVHNLTLADRIPMGMPRHMSTYVCPPPVLKCCVAILAGKLTAHGMDCTQHGANFCATV